MSDPICSLCGQSLLKCQGFCSKAEREAYKQKQPLCNNECLVRVNNNDQCDLLSPLGYFRCSRKKGHEGIHSACGVEHDLISWDEEAHEEN